MQSVLFFVFFKRCPACLVREKSLCCCLKSIVMSAGFSNSTWKEFGWCLQSWKACRLQSGAQWCLIAGSDFIWQPFAPWGTLKLSYYCNSLQKKLRWSLEAKFNCCSCDMCNWLNTLVFFENRCQVMQCCFIPVRHVLSHTKFLSLPHNSLVSSLPHSTGTFVLPHQQ